MATYKPYRKTESGKDEIKLPYSVLSNPPAIPTSINGLTGGTVNGNITLTKQLVFNDTNNPFIQMQSSGNTYYFQAYDGKFGLGASWGKATKFDENGNVEFAARPKVGTDNVALQSDIPTVNNGTLTIQKNGTKVATFSANQSGNVTANITVPTMTLSGTTLYITL